MTPLTEAQAQTCESPGPPPSAAVEREEAEGEMLRALSHLPDKQREVIRLKFQDAMSYKEISQVTGLSVSNVGFLIHTAIRSLRKRIADQSDLHDKGLQPLVDGDAS